MMEGLTNRSWSDHPWTTSTGAFLLGLGALREENPGLEAVGIRESHLLVILGYFREEAWNFH